MTQEDFYRIAVGIKASLVTYASLTPNDTAALKRAIDSNTVVCNTARLIATELGTWYPDVPLAAFIEECAMELGGDGKWRVPANSTYVQTYPL